MQTFLPYAFFPAVARTLDWRRLGKQRVEVLKIINIITTPDYTGAWMHHPAIKMWRGYEHALMLYVNYMIEEWKRRGYQNTLPYYDLQDIEIEFPWWLGDPRLHASHRSNLLRKDPTYYRQFGWDEPNDLSYFWPVK